MAKLSRVLILVGFIILSFGQMAKAQYVQQGKPSEYISDGKIVIDGVSVDLENAVDLMGDNFGNQYKAALRQRNRGGLLVIGGAAAMGIGAACLVTYESMYNVNDRTNNMDRWVSVTRTGDYGYLFVAGGIVSVIAGGLMKQGATKKINVIRNSYNKSLSQDQVSCTFGFTGNGLSLALNF